MKQIPVIILYLLVVFSAGIPGVTAHESIPAHTCSKPAKPAQISSRWELETFQLANELFERCMFDYIRDQQKQSQRHEQAAQSTLDEWSNHLQPDIDQKQNVDR